MIFQPVSNILVPFMQPQFGRGRVSGGYVPPSIAGYDLNLDSTLILGLSDSDPVATWEDQSVNGYDFTEATNKPLFKTAIFGALPGVLFDGSDDRLKNATLAATQPCTIYAVGKWVTVTANYRAFSDTGGAFERFTGKDNSQFIAYAGAQLNSGLTASDGLAFVYAAVFNGGSSELKINATSVSGNAGAGSSNAGMIIGASFYATPQDFANIYLGQMIVYPSAHTGGQQATLMSELATKWSI